MWWAQSQHPHSYSCGIPFGQEQGVPHKKAAEHSSTSASLLFSIISRALGCLSSPTQSLTARK